MAVLTADTLQVIQVFVFSYEPISWLVFTEMKLYNASERQQ